MDQAIPYGARVGLLVGGMIVEEGILMRNEAKPRTWTGNISVDQRLVCLSRIIVRRDGSPDVGSFVVCNYEDMVRLDMGFDEKEPDAEDNSVDNDLEEGAGVIQPSCWISLLVKVVDDFDVFFATAMIASINPDVVLQGIQLGDTYVGILITEFGNGANAEHRKHKDSLVAWKMSRLIAPGGKWLSYHYRNQEVAIKDAGSGKRSYVNRMRPRKKPRIVISKKDKCMTQEDISMISTKDCCLRRCCQLFNRQLALLVRERHWKKPYQERKQEEIFSIQNCLTTIEGEELIGLEGIPVCLEAWRIVHGKGRTQFNHMRQKVQGGKTVAEHGNRGKKRMSARVSQALSSTRMLVKESADYHPAKWKTMADNSREVLQELPFHLTWESIRERVNEINIKNGVGPISQPTMSSLHKTYLENVVIHKKGNSFTKCSICSELQQRKAHMIGGKEEYEQLKADEREHHEDHSSRRLLYHAWRAHSIVHPKASLCIIHDKMDHCKTALPRLPRTPKGLENCQQLPITLTGILTHGHGPGAVAQYNVGVWPSDPNATIGSLDSILRMLENPKTVMESVLQGPDSTDLFTKLLLGRKELLQDNVRKAFKTDTQTIHEKETSPTSGSSSFKQLPRILRLQLDNCASDNKNRFVMAYLSLLTAREVFEEIHLGFLMVGHTHEDVDAMFGNFSETLMHKPTYSLADLMSLLMKARTPSAVPHFVQEVPDFKSYLQPFMLKGGDTLVGHLKPRLFRFYVREDGMPCFQYKIKSNEVAPWLPSGGIEMWSWKNDRVPNLPQGSPKRLPMVEIKMLEDVKQGIAKYVNFFEVVERKSVTQELKMPWTTLVRYWTDILHTLEEPVQYRDEDGEDLVQGFWPRSNWKDHIPIMFRNLACEIDPEEDYVGPVKNKPREAFQPRLDIMKDHFILQRPASEDIESYPIHMGRVVSAVEEGEVNANNKLEHICWVEWFRPHMASKWRLQCEQRERWNNCWDKKWERDDKGYPERCKISINSIVWCFKPRQTKSGLVTIPKAHVPKAQDNLKRSIEADP